MATTPTPPPTNWATVQLVQDSDLTAQESHMPAMAKALRTPEGISAYDGKRQLVKTDIEAWLRRRNMAPDFLVTPSQLTRAAVFLELSYIYSDMANRDESVAAMKAASYLKRYREELDTIALDYVENAPPVETNQPKYRPMIYLSRA
jgi:hypothetical protein